VCQSPARTQIPIKNMEAPVSGLFCKCINAYFYICKIQNVSMRILPVLVLIIMVFFLSCRQENEPVDNPYDKISVLPLQETFVLLSTATWCGYCGEWGIDAFEDAFAGGANIDPNRVNGLALHYSASDPMYVELSSELKSDFEIGGPPNLWIEFNNSWSYDPDGWKDAVAERQSISSVVCGVGMYSEYSSGVYTIYVKVKFFSSFSGNCNLAVYVIENNIISPQYHNDLGVIETYKHMRVLRGEATDNNAFGSNIINGLAPDEFTASYRYTPSAAMNASNLHFVAVLYEMNESVPVSTLNSCTY